jgi:hypothetical protein
MTTRALSTLARRSGPIFLLVLAFTLLNYPPWAYGDPNPLWVNVFSGNTTLFDQPVPVGAVITAHGPGGVQCGEFIVRTEGTYGYLPCYRDDPTTSDDAGPQPGDQISFRINGLYAGAVPISLNGMLVDPSTHVTWTRLGDRWEVDLQAPQAVGGVTAPAGASELLAPWLVLVLVVPLTALGILLVRRGTR